MKNRSPSEAGASTDFRQEAVVTGIRWSGVIQILSESLRIIGSVVLARLLAPEDFGLMALAIVITGFLAVIQYLGTGGIIIQKKELPDELLSSLFILNLVFGILLFLGLLLGGSYLAGLFNTSQAASVIRIFGLTILITSAGIVQNSLLARNMRFDLLARIKLAEIIVYSAVSIPLALMGWRVWALVTASLAGTLSSTSYLWIVCNWRPRLVFRWVELRKILGFGLNLTGSNIVEYLTRNVDRLIIGRWLGSISLGYYSIAYRFCLFPIESIAPVLLRVLFPAFSRIQDDSAQFQKIFLRACGGIAFISFPLIAGLCVIAGPLVLVLLGPKWEQTIPIITILCSVGILRTLSAPTNDVLLARGRSDWLFGVLLASGVALAIGMYLGLAWGITGVAVAYAIVTLPSTCLRLAAALKSINLGFLSLLISLRPYIFATALMSILVLGCRLSLEAADVEQYLVLIICICLGIVSYSIMILFIRPAALFDFLKILPISDSRTGRILDMINKFPHSPGERL